MHANQKPRRRHSEQFKAQVLAACAEPGASVSAVALSFGLNDNLVHQWRRGRGYRLKGATSASEVVSQGQPQLGVAGAHDGSAGCAACCGGDSLKLPLKIGVLSSMSGGRFLLRRQPALFVLHWAEIAKSRM